MDSKLKLFSRIFLGIFILTSVALYFFSSFVSHPSQLPGQPLPSNTGSVVTYSVTISTAVISLLGFLITTTLSFRREKREARESELSLKQKEIELERARLELEQLKKQVNKKKK
jgi:cell shape-determining protein MreC